MALLLCRALAGGICRRIRADHAPQDDHDGEKGAHLGPLRVA
jgi:hypothetical protein